VRRRARACKLMSIPSVPDTAALRQHLFGLWCALASAGVDGSALNDLRDFMM